MHTVCFQGYVTLVLYDIHISNLKSKLLGLAELSKRGFMEACLVGKGDTEGSILGPHRSTLT